MADEKLSQKNPATNLVGSDIYYLVQDTAGTPVTRKGTLAQLATFINSQGSPQGLLWRNEDASPYTFALTDAGHLLRRRNGVGSTDTIPANSAVAFPVGTVITLRRANDGTLTIGPASGVTLNTPTGHAPSARVKGSVLMIHKVDTDVWDITGDLTAA